MKKIERLSIFFIRIFVLKILFNIIFHNKSLLCQKIVLYFNMKILILQIKITLYSDLLYEIILQCID